MATARQGDLTGGDSGTTAGTSKSTDLCESLREFLSSCQRPSVVEPGEPLQFLREGEYSLEPVSAGAALLEVWGEEKVLRRRIVGIRRESGWKVEAVIEKFGRKRGTLTFLDADAGAAPTVERGAARAENLAALRRWCERLFPAWRIEQSSSAPDLENSLSPRFPRVMLRAGSQGMAVLSAPDGEITQDALAFALIWFKHAQLRWPAITVKTLAVFVAEEDARSMALRMQGLSTDVVRPRLFAVPADGFPREFPLSDCGNLESAVPRLGAYLAADRRIRAIFEEVAAGSEAEVVEDLRGGLHLELHGLPLAICNGDRVRAGLALREARREVTADRLRALANRTARIRHGDSTQRQHPIYGHHPERWLEAMVRRNAEKIDPLIDSSTLRRQVTGQLGAERSRTDLLGLDREGRLVILEIKVSEDISLPIQALDYYSRLRVQLQRGEIDNGILFPGRKVQSTAPRVLLVAPALQFHPTNETLLGCFESSIDVRQIGVALEWRKSLRVVFDHPRQRPNSGKGSEWQAAFSVRSGRPSPR